MKNHQAEAVLINSPKAILSTIQQVLRSASNRESALSQLTEAGSVLILEVRLNFSDKALFNVSIDVINFRSSVLKVKFTAGARRSDSADRWKVKGLARMRDCVHVANIYVAISPFCSADTYAMMMCITKQIFIMNSQLFFLFRLFSSCSTNYLTCG